MYVCKYASLVGCLQAFEQTDTISVYSEHFLLP